MECSQKLMPFPMMGHAMAKGPKVMDVHQHYAKDQKVLHQINEILKF